MKPSLDSLRLRTTVSDSGCWLWSRYVRGDGYAVITVRLDGKTQAMYVHRLAYEAAHGAIPEGSQLDHLCRVRHCINPDHLEAVAPVENYRRGMGPTANNARKTHCKHGHEFTPANTHNRPSGGRTCRECARVKLRRRRAARKAAQ